MISKRNSIIILVVALIVVIAAVVIYSLTPRSYIKFATAPGTVFIAIDNGPKQTVENGSTMKVSPGTHTISVSQNEFDPYVKEITLKNGQTSEFLVALNPLTDAATALLQDQASQDVIQRFYGNIMTKQTDDITKKYPIVKDLPIQARLYVISACPSKKYPNDASKIALCVDLYHDSLEPYVLKDISSRGYNPNDYEIIWNDKFSNPSSAATAGQ